MISHQELLNLVSYDPETGIFTALVQRGTVTVGSVIGNNHCNGYVQFAINKKMYLAHRVAFFYMTGRWPVEIDHRNRNKKDNRWQNLREATKSQNNYNKGPHGTNRSGYKGVSWCAKRSKWAAFIKAGPKQTFLGYFNDKEEARRAYVRAASKMHGEFARVA